MKNLSIISTCLLLALSCSKPGVGSKNSTTDANLSMCDKLNNLGRNEKVDKEKQANGCWQFSKYEVYSNSTYSDWTSLFVLTEAQMYMLVDSANKTASTCSTKKGKADPSDTTSGSSIDGGKNDSALEDITYTNDAMIVTEYTNASKGTPSLRITFTRVSQMAIDSANAAGCTLTNTTSTKKSVNVLNSDEDQLAKDAASRVNKVMKNVTSTK